MSNFIRLALAAAVIAPSAVSAQAGTPWDMKEWTIERGGRSRDPYVAPDGKVFFAGQQGNYVGMVDPASGAVKYYELEENTNPHTVIVDDQGTVWYAGNRNGRIGKLDPKTGEIIYDKKRIPEGVAFTSSPWAYKGHIFCLNEDGVTFVIKAGPEFEIVRTNSLDELCMATPAIAHGALFIRTNTKLYRIQEGKEGRPAS